MVFNLLFLIIFITSYIIVISLEDTTNDNSNANEIFYRICIGSARQCFPIAVDTLSFHTIIKDDNITFNKSASYTLLNLNEGISGESAIRVFKGIVHRDFIIHDGYSDKKFTFVIANYPMNVLGLALNYTDDIVVNEQYFFGCDLKYSFIEHMYLNHQITNRVFSIEDKKFEIGKKNDGINADNTCQCQHDLEYDHYDFFWNCKFNRITLENSEYSLGYNMKIVIDSRMKGISLPKSVTKILMNSIVISSKGQCSIESSILNETKKGSNRQLKCNQSVNMNSLPLILFERGSLVLKVHSKELFNYDKEENVYYFNAKIEVFNDVIVIGKLLFDNYYVEFNRDEKSLGFIQRKEIRSNLSSGYINRSKAMNKLIVVSGGLALSGIVLIIYSKVFIINKKYNNTRL